MWFNLSDSGQYSIQRIAKKANLFFAFCLHRGIMDMPLDSDVKGLHHLNLVALALVAAVGGLRIRRVLK